MDGWKNIKLGEVVSIRRGSSPRPIKDYLITEGGMPWVKISDATDDNGKYINSTAEQIKMEGVPRSVIVNPGDLILSNSGTAGLPKFMGIQACIHDGWQTFTDLKGIDKEYLYYYLLYIREILLHNAYDSVMKNLTLDMLRDFEMKLPPIDVQKKIVKVLSLIDEKIELNKRINKELLEEAQSIFEHEIAELEDKPSAWKKGNLTDIAEYLNGLAMQKFRPQENEEGMPVLKIKELRQGYCDDNSDLCSSSIKEEYIVEDGDVIFSWSGSLLVDFWCGGKCGLNQHLFKVSSKKYDSWFYYCWTNYHLAKFIAIAADKATTMGHIKRSELSKAEVWIPDETDYKRLHKVISPLFDLLIQKRLENSDLEKLRDNLIPKLVSGELDTSDVTI